MATNEIRIDASPEAVFAVLSDPERYSEWVVGTRETHAVDPEWPAPGAKLRYEAGVGPLALSDVTEVVESEPPSRLVLDARMRPFGVTRIELQLHRLGDGTRLVMHEEPVEGLVDATHTPISDAALSKRNDVSLGRLRRLVEGTT